MQIIAIISSIYKNRAKNSMTNDKVKILLVEDNPGDARLTMEAFKDARLEHDMLHVKDGVEALQFLRKEGDFKNVDTPNIVLLDINMPRMSGLELLQEIQQDENLSKIIFIVLTTSEADRDIASAYTLNANCFIKKPGECQIKGSAKTC